MTPDLSVVVPTHNRDDVLRKTLAGIDDQRLPRERFEVIVVDDGSEPDCRERLRALCAGHSVRLVEKRQGGLASARNRGAAEARGAILHFLDDDVLPAPDSFTQHLASHEAAREPVAVVGSLPYPPHVQMNCFLWYLEQCGHYDLYRYAHRKYEGGAPPMPPLNGNSSLRRETFNEVGTYDESFRQYGSEDLELGYRLARAGVRFVYNPDALGYHDHIKDFPRFCVDMERAGESLIRLYRKYPEIKSPKKIDLMTDRLHQLPLGKWPAKMVLSATFAAPWVLGPPRAFLRVAEDRWSLRRLAFPFYRLVSHHHYAAGMRRALAESG